MYFSRITMNNRAQFSSGFWKLFRDPYTLHKSIWGIFGDKADRKRDFLYRYDLIDGRPLMYSVSDRLPDQGIASWDIETKTYNPQIKSGMVLSFMLRANPIRTKRDAKRKQYRHDVVMDAKKQLKAHNSTEGRSKTLAGLMQEEGFKWLSARAEKNGFAINQDQIRVESYRQHHFIKNKGKRQINISTLDFIGLLTVIEPDLFLGTLYNGIGPAKGFGCGMMMIKRI